MTPPTRTHDRRSDEIRLEEADDGYHHHRLIDAAGVEPHGDAVTGRIPLFFNSDIVMGVVRPAEAMPESVFYRNGEADECSTSTRVRACWTRSSGRSATAPATISSCRSARPGAWTRRGSEQRMLFLECPSEIEPPKRYRNDYGQLLEHSPYSQRDIRLPDEVPARTDEGEFRVHVKMRTG